MKTLKTLFLAAVTMMAFACSNKEVKQEEPVAVAAPAPEAAPMQTSDSLSLGAASSGRGI
ncbi:MAG: hypothetical protein AB7P04_10685 [Bacteriovoracia bacterium]